MCSPQPVLDKIVEKITEILIQSVASQVGYLIHYKKNVKNLEAKMEDLGKQRGKIEGNVEEAKNLGEIIEDDVLNWLTEADKKKEDVEEFMETIVVKENRQCLKCSCPDFIWRYRLSKRAEKQTTAIGVLVEKSDFQRIAHPAPPPLERRLMLTEDFGTFDSRTSVFKEILEALKDSNVKTIGIYGTGGVGKTTMVEEVSKKVQQDGLFDQVVMVVVSQSVNIDQIQEHLADRLSFREKLTATNEDGRADQLWNRLKNGKKNLVILDDVWQKLNLKQIGIPITDGSKGCKVVLTSRSQDVCRSMNVEKKFPIEALSNPEAWLLFKKHVGNSFDTPEMESVANAVCEECGGLPVAILAVGAALKDKEKYVWEDYLEKLRKSMLKSIDKTIEDRVFSLLKLSYDYITLKDAKSCFLLCSLFPEDAEIRIDDLVRYGVGIRLLENVDTLEKARNRVLMLVDTLKTSCLLSSYGEYTVKMHDVIRDVAILIAKDDEAFLVKHGVQEWPEQGTFERCSAISLRSKYIHELPHELVCPQLHTLVLECTNPSLRVPESFFHGLEELNVLDMIGMRISPLPSSFRNLVNLRTLSLYRCKLTDTAVLKVLKNLEVLSLRHSDIEELAPAMRQLTRLRSLDLQFCDRLRIIPPNIISSLSRLEELFISYSFGRWEVAEPTTNEGGTNASLAELNSLTRLTALEIHIPKGMSLPKDQILERLVRFKISVGSTFFLFPHYYSSTNMLKVDSISLKNEINILLAKAEVLHLKGWQGLKNVLRDGEGKRFFELKEMSFENIDDLEHLFGKQRGYLQTLRPQQQWALFSKLSKLEVIDCKLKYLFSPSIARELAVLESVSVEGCENMEEIVGNESGGGDESDDHEEITNNVVIFHKLRRMDLQRLPNLRSFYSTKKKKKSTTTTEGNHLITAEAEPLFNEKVAFPSLEELTIEEMSNIIELWDKNLPPTDSFYQLMDVRVKECENLVNLIPSIMLPRLQNLKELYVSGSPKMEVIVSANDIIGFPQLTDLSLENLPNLNSFSSYRRSKAQTLFNYQVALPALDYLRIDGVPNITEIWNCDKLVNVASSKMLSRLLKLEYLSITRCPKMEVIIVLEKEKEKETANDDIVVFPQLSSDYTLKV